MGTTNSVLKKTLVVLSTSVDSCAHLDPAPRTVRGPLFRDTECKIKIYFFPSFQNKKANQKVECIFITVSFVNCRWTFSDRDFLISL